MDDKKKGKRSLNTRRGARECAMQGVYQWLMNRERTPTSIESHLMEERMFAKDPLHELFRGLLLGTIREHAVLEEKIEPFSDRPICELSPVERSILLVGAFELLHHRETPCPVIINEFIEIAKSFGGTDGHKFVNGILDKLALHERGDELKSSRYGKPVP